jgi:hypothetical protein
VAALLLGVAGDAFAQGTGAPPPPWGARFELAAGVGWFNADPERGDADWYNDTLWYGVEGGYFFTEHVKAEFGVSAATEGSSWSTETPVDSAGRPVSYVSSQHAHRVSSFSAGLTYQFGSNAWVHPYLGAGVDIDRDRVRTTSWVQPHYPRAGYEVPYQLPEEVTTEMVPRVFAVAGAKLFITQHVFFKADVKVAGQSGVDKVTARVLFGADF